MRFLPSLCRSKQIRKCDEDTLVEVARTSKRNDTGEMRFEFNPHARTVSCRLVGVFVPVGGAADYFC